MNQKKIMKHPIRKQALETLWRRELTVDERGRLEQHFAGDEGQRLFFEEEEALSRLLTGVADAPLSSNFTARVVAAARLEKRRSGRVDDDLGLAALLGRWRGYFHRSWTTPTMAAGLILVISITAFYQAKSYRRQQLAQTLATVTKATAMPEIEVLQDFDAIRHLGRVQMSQSTMEMDAALLAALQ